MMIWAAAHIINLHSPWSAQVVGIHNRLQPDRVSNTCHEEGVRDRNRAGIESADLALRAALSSTPNHLVNNWLGGERYRHPWGSQACESILSGYRNGVVLPTLHYLSSISLQLRRMRGFITLDTADSDQRALEFKIRPLDSYIRRTIRCTIVDPAVCSRTSGASAHVLLEPNSVVRDRNRAEIEAADPALRASRGIGNFDSNSIPSRTPNQKIWCRKARLCQGVSPRQCSTAINAIYA
eukprot:gene18724-biopygen5608